MNNKKHYKQSINERIIINIQGEQMDPQRKNRSDKYHEKKMHREKHDKLQKQSFSEEESNLIASIQQMKPSELLKFMENKFEKLIQTNQKLFSKLATAARKRFLSFEQSFEKSEKGELKDFVKKHTGYSIVEEDIKQIFDPKSRQPFKLKNNDLVHISYVWSKQTKPQIRFVKVTIFEPKQQFSNIKQRFYETSQWKDLEDYVDMKRFKKQFTADLEEYVNFRKLVEEGRNEPDN